MSRSRPVATPNHPESGKRSSSGRRCQTGSVKRSGIAVAMWGRGGARGRPNRERMIEHVAFGLRTTESLLAYGPRTKYSSVLSRELRNCAVRVRRQPESDSQRDIQRVTAREKEGAS